MLRRTALIALLLCACGSSEVPLPSIVSVDPQHMATNERILLEVVLEGALQFKLDYGEGSAELFTETRVGIADREFQVVRVEDQGQRLIAEILPGLPQGSQDLRVAFEDGREVVLEQGFEVMPPLALTGFRIEPIGPQIRQTPFTILLLATGPDAANFQGRVKLSSSKGTVDPPVSRPFEAGVLLQEISIDDTGGNNVAILVEDYAGHTGISNEFRLDPN